MARAVPEHELAHLGAAGRPSSGNASRRLAQHRPLGVAEHAVPGLLRVVRIAARRARSRAAGPRGATCRNSQRRRAAWRAGSAPTPARSAACRPRNAISRSAQTLAPRARIDRRADRRRTHRAARTRRAPRATAGRRRRPTASMMPEARQQLQVEPDAHEPARVGEVLACGDVPDQRARVELGLVGADQQHREPRVVGGAGTEPASAAWRSVSGATSRSSRRS